MNLTEYGKENNLTDEELVQYAKQQFGMDEEDIWLMLAVERGESDGDVTEVES